MKQITLLIWLFFSLTMINAQVIVDLTNCNDNCIWSINNVGTIQSWSIDGLTPINQGNPLVSSNNGIAIGHVPITPDTTLNTFVAAFSPDRSLSYWDGTNWVKFDFTLPFSPLGIGGYKNDFFIIYASGIAHFDGQNMPTVIASITISIADIAVDELGRAWIYENNPQSIVVLDRQGNTVNQFPLNTMIDNQNGYGTFLKKDTFFIGFGGLNNTFPEQIVAVIIENNMAKIGRTIDFSNTSLVLYDLAVKSPGNPLNPPTNNIDFDSKQISIYPNPAIDFLIVEQQHDQPIELTLFNLQGILLREWSASSSQTRIPIGELPAAPYFIVVKQDGKVIKQQKWVKIN